MTKPRKSLARRPTRAGVASRTAGTRLHHPLRRVPRYPRPTRHGGSDRWWQELDGLGQLLHLRVPRPGGS